MFVASFVQIDRVVFFPVLYLNDRTDMHFVNNPFWAKGTKKNITTKITKSFFITKLSLLYIVVNMRK